MFAGSGASASSVNGGRTPAPCMPGITPVLIGIPVMGIPGRGPGTPGAPAGAYGTGLQPGMTIGGQPIGGRIPPGYIPMPGPYGFSISCGLNMSKGAGPLKPLPDLPMELKPLPSRPLPLRSPLEAKPTFSGGWLAAISFICSSLTAALASSMVERRTKPYPLHSPASRSCTALTSVTLPKGSKRLRSFSSSVSAGKLLTINRTPSNVSGAISFRSLGLLSCSMRPFAGRTHKQYGGTLSAPFSSSFSRSSFSSGFARIASSPTIGLELSSSASTSFLAASATSAASAMARSSSVLMSLPCNAATAF
mmetsp:Transcript_5289/g.12739  ORF Transcript_5289/g.12739 Transcript_5289/m.12739 type:complete len:307 (+) Transcript_5289:325-1245(+)